jgi:hypothetical protein
MTPVQAKMARLCILCLLLVTGQGPSATLQARAVGTFTDGFAITYDFEAGSEGWTVSSSPQVRGISRAGWTTEQVKSGSHAMKLTVDLDSNVASKRSGEILVDMRLHPPQGLPSSDSIDLRGKTVSAWVYVPAAARGDPKYPNGGHLFVHDAGGNKLYGTWQNFPGAGWFQITLPITDKKPVCGSIEPGFDPSKIRIIGVNIGVPVESSVTFHGPIYLDAIAFGTPSAPVSDHLYDFESPGALDRIPHWGLIPGWGAEGLDPPVIQDGALALTAHFTIPAGEEIDELRKGAVGIIYSPTLDLSNKDNATISADIRFDPPATNVANCPFVLSIGAYDEHKQKWFWSDNIQVGSGDWTSVRFDLGDRTQLKPEELDYEGDIPTLSEIRQIAFQLWANIPYNGRVLFDNIAVGGEERSYALTNQGIVQAESGQFILNGQPFRFVGANAEYLFTKPSPAVEGVLDLARSMGIQVIRTWGFSEGCEDNTIESCVIWSRRFQPGRGQWNETAFEQFDRIVAIAGERGIRLIVPLANNWAEYGGKPQYVAWLEQEHPEDIPPEATPGTSTYDDLFYTNNHVKAWYKEYVTRFISRTNSITGIPYSQDPTIFAWELINEPRARTDVSGAKLHEWIVEMSEFVDGLDPHHLIGTGEEGWYVMPKASADARGRLSDGTIWQNFPGNYWEYGVNYRPEGEAPWSSDGVDFVSDHSSADTEVCWQAYAGDSDQAPVECEIRDGVPHIDFTSMHLYIGAGASSLYHAPYCEAGFDDTLCNPTYDRTYHQAFLWITEHMSDTLALGKPMIIGEFGFRTSGVGVLASGQQPAHIPPFEPRHRAKLFEWYLDSMFDLGVHGALFWNIGIKGFPESLWDGGDSLENWQYDINSDSTNLKLCPGPEHVTQGRYSLCVDYDPGKGYGKAFIDRVNTSNSEKDWSTEHRHRLRFDTYSDTALSVSVGIITGESQTWYESQPQPLTSGWNTITLDTTSEIWKSAATGGQYHSSVGDLDDVRQVSIGAVNYSTTGTFYVDNLRHVGNDGLVIYAEDPAILAIQYALCQNWLECFYLPMIFKACSQN